MNIFIIFVMCSVSFVIAETENRSSNYKDHSAPSTIATTYLNKKKQDKRYIHSYYNGVGTGYGADGLYNNYLRNILNSGYGNYGIDNYGSFISGSVSGYPSASYSRYYPGTEFGGYGSYGNAYGNYRGYGSGYDGFDGINRYNNPYRVSEIGYSGFNNYNGYPYYSTYSGVGNYPLSRLANIGYGNRYSF